MRLTAVITLLATTALLAGCSGGSRSVAEAPKPLVIRNNQLPAMESLRPIEVDVLSAGQPNAAQLAAFAAAGVTTVIDLRGDDEDRGFDELSEVLELQMDYVAIPIGGIESMTDGAVAAFDDAIVRARGPVLVHCRSGNRVGAMVALRAARAGASVEEAMAKGIAAGMESLQGPVRERLESAGK